MIRRQLALLLGCLAFLRLPAADLASLPPEPVWAADAPEWLALEAYLAQRAAGLPVETPAVRP